MLDEALTEDATTAEGGLRQDILPVVPADDSPLGHAIRRRRHELAHPDMVVVATHDSMILTSFGLAPSR